MAGRTKAKRKIVNIENLRQLVAEANVTYYQIEKDCKIGIAIVSRGLKENSARPLPPRWELPIIKYLKKKIDEKNSIEYQTTKALEDLGIKVPEKESDLSITEKEIKKSWFEKLHL